MFVGNTYFIQIVDATEAIAKQAVKDKLDALRYTTLPEPCTYPHTSRFSP